MKSILFKIIGTLFILNFSFLNATNAQTVFTIDNNQLVQTGGYLVLKNTKLQNDGTLQANSGTVVISGDAANSDAAIAGTSLTTFYNLEINKTSNGTQLENDINIINQLTLTSGNIDIQSYDLTIQNTTNISGGSASSYVKTSDIGVLTQEVSNSNVVFPVGNQSYTPVTLNNSGAVDDFNVRVENVVYENGTSGNAITTDVVDVTWFIDEASAGGSDVTATFQWNASDELTDFDRTQSFVSVYHTSQWNNGTASAASGSDPYTKTETGITTFSPFSIVSDATVLPVELLYFYGEMVENYAALSWETAAEINNDYFDVEWSMDGIHFETIGRVKGAGTTLKRQAYEFNHFTPVIGQNYYRLKQVDFDEQFEYSPIVIINLEQEEQYNNTTINIYPNPASNFLTIETTENGLMQLFDISGRLMVEKQIPTFENIDVSELPSGTYFVKMGEQVKKIIIQQ